MSLIFTPSTVPSLPSNYLPFSPPSHCNNEKLMQTMPENMAPEDQELFKRTVSSTDLREAAILWEDYFLPKYPTPFFMIRVADIRARLNSPITALYMYEQVKHYLEHEQVTNSEFQEFLSQFEASVSSWIHEQTEKDKQVECRSYWRPSRAHRFPTSLPRPPHGAEELLSVHPSTPIWTMLTNLIIMETNQIEAAFLLTRVSTQDVVMNGIDAAYIESMPESATHDKNIIRSILLDTAAAYQMLGAVAADTELFTPAFIRRLHSTVVKSSRIDSTGTRYNPAGLTRTGTKKASFIKGDVYSIDCCPPEQVDQELEYICWQARQWIKTWGDVRNPFAASAWIHFLVSQCHPFEDGNGRVARMLACIPLLRQGYPPICISGNFARRYYAALQRAYEGLYEDLARCFVESTANAIEEVASWLQ